MVPFGWFLTLRTFDFCFVFCIVNSVSFFIVMFFCMKNKAFTLVEMMIAIAVFSVGVLTILNLLINNLYVMNKASTRTQASFLAKEWIELVYHLRDSNVLRSYPWNCLPEQTQANSQPFSSYQRSLSPEELSVASACDRLLWTPWNYIFDIGFSHDAHYTIYRSDKTSYDSRDEAFQENALFLKTGDNSLSNHRLYMRDPSEDTFTKFARYLVVKPLIEDGSPLAAGNILKLESHVLYKNGSRTGEVIFESFIWNY